MMAFKTSSTNPRTTQKSVYVAEDGPVVIVPVETIEALSPELLGMLVKLLAIDEEPDTEKVAKDCGVSVEGLRQLVQNLHKLGYINYTASKNVVAHAIAKKMPKKPKKVSVSERNRVLRPLFRAFMGDVKLPDYQYPKINEALMSCYETVRKHDGHEDLTGFDPESVERTRHMILRMKQKAKGDGMTVKSPVSILYLLPDFTLYLPGKALKHDDGLVSA